MCRENGVISNRNSKSELLKSECRENNNVWIQKLIFIENVSHIPSIMATTKEVNVAPSSSQNAGPNYQILRDPNLSKNRIYVGNLPLCTKPQLESICQPYGNVLASALLKNFGFVQFESEAIANKAIAAINGSVFKGQTISCQSASLKPQSTAKRQQNANAMGQHKELQPMPIPRPEGGDYNDCEIIVLDRNNTQYAEYIESRLKRLNLRVDLLFPNADVPLGKVLSNISARRCLYAVLVTSQHQEHNSITVNILYGVPAEHRNMPVEDAIALIGTDFRRKMMQDNANQQPLMAIQRPTVHMDQPMPVIPAIKDRHPENIQVLINLLADNVRLTVLQFNVILKYLEELREDQIKVELGTTNTLNKPKTPDPEIGLQRRILDILNKPSVADNRYPLMYPSPDSVKQDIGLIQLLNDERVQRAIDSLMDSNLVSTIQDYMKF